MRSRIGLFDQTCIRRTLQPSEELNVRTVIHGCFFAERVSENLEEIRNLQRMLSQNLAMLWIR
jgi:hypothetical protein